MEEHKAWNLSSCACTEIIDGCEVHHKEITHRDVTIHLVECGNPDGELVLLLHGFPNFWYVWKNQFKPLHDMGYHIVAPDLRGYNTSSKPQGIRNYGRAEVLSDIICLIECFNAGKPTNIVGHDWGVIVALSLAEDAPDVVRRLIVVNGPHPKIMLHVILTNIHQLYRSWYIFFFQLPWLPERVFSKNGFEKLKKALEQNGLPEDDVERYVQAWSVPGSVTSSMNYYRAIFWGYWLRKKPQVKLNIPVTVIWGELDKFLVNELANVPRDIFSKVSVLQIPKVFLCNLS
ncbi:uncharacterized protein LOC131040062 [Cryptomeria japonica]|uniref:uncharacterized protein LOC131040062 n=1 Tax=Cryptomeria japonica TaxID=3369 RepID=UPI0027D9F6AA|nr:uncharacterized protein LOC131040062 [Cryptomeria japonica]XP_057828937.2 uncharacterized protein LOC131040062 [Cryptomeria japonica]XP_057828938.2 uncharacterized protein LOC131040062 [Cryptomeria japonica]